MLAKFDSNGRPEGFYVPDEQGNAPPYAPGGLVDISDEDWGFFCGQPDLWVWQDGARVANPDYVEPPPFVPPLPAISDRQFAQQLSVLGLITRDEALAWVKRGEIPEAIQDIISTMAPDDAFHAEMLLGGATTFERNHPVTAAFGAAAGMSPEDLDDLWRAAAAL